MRLYYEDPNYCRLFKQPASAGVAQLVERLLAKEKVDGSKPFTRFLHSSNSTTIPQNIRRYFFQIQAI